MFGTMLERFRYFFGIDVCIVLGIDFGLRFGTSGPPFGKEMAPSRGLSTPTALKVISLRQKGLVAK